MKHRFTTHIEEKFGKKIEEERSFYLCDGQRFQNWCKLYRYCENEVKLVNFKNKIKAQMDI